MRITKSAKTWTSKIVQRGHLTTEPKKINADNFFCTFCGITKKSYSALNSHLRIQHGKGGHFKCTHCSYTTFSDQAASAHKKACGYEILCPKCPFKCDRTSRLTRHLKMHCPPSFRCKKCDKMFRYRHNLHVHQKRCKL